MLVWTEHVKYSFLAESWLEIKHTKERNRGRSLHTNFYNYTEQLSLEDKREAQMASCCLWKQKTISEEGLLWKQMGQHSSVSLHCIWPFCNSQDSVEGLLFDTLPETYAEAYSVIFFVAISEKLFNIRICLTLVSSYSLKDLKLYFLIKYNSVVHPCAAEAWVHHASFFLSLTLKKLFPKFQVFILVISIF